MRSVSIAQAKDRFTELLYEAEEGRPVLVTRRGKAVAILVAETEYQRLVSMARPDFAAWNLAWRGRLSAGFEGVTAEEFARWADR